MSKTTETNFYKESLKLLTTTKIPFMVGGTYAFNSYIGTDRHTSDLDIFCKAGDYTKILQIFHDKGYKTQITDERWIAKVLKGKYRMDLIFNSAIAVTPVSDEWLKESQVAKIFNTEVKLLPPTELIWSKVFVQIRDKYHGHDIGNPNHLSTISCPEVKIGNRCL